MRTIFLTAFMATAALRQPLQAQDVESYKFDIGASAGMSGYLGDANQSNMFRHPGVAAALTGRYLADERWAARVSAGLRTLSGNTADMATPLSTILPRVRNSTSCPTA